MAESNVPTIDFSILPWMNALALYYNKDYEEAIRVYPEYKTPLDYVKRISIKDSKFHVKAALEAAVKVGTEMYKSSDFPWDEEDKAAILNAYPEDNIK